MQPDSEENEKQILWTIQTFFFGMKGYLLLEENDSCKSCETNECRRLQVSKFLLAEIDRELFRKIHSKRHNFG